jgi:hypothetical protein
VTTRKIIILSVLYWIADFYVSGATATVPCPPVTDCKTPALNLLYTHLLWSLVIYFVLLGTALLIRRARSRNARED